VLCAAQHRRRCSRAVTYHEVVQQVADDMVSEGLLQQQELGLMAPPVCFMPRQTLRQVRVHEFNQTEVYADACLLQSDSCGAAAAALFVCVERN